MAIEYASYSPDSKQIIEAFTDGVNAFIKSTSASEAWPCRSMAHPG
jgi:acyl-homoserine lactone acylase PvdQ